MKYEKPEAKVILFNNGDVVTSSAYDPEDPMGYCRKSTPGHHKHCYSGKHEGHQLGRSGGEVVQTYADYWSEW